MIKRVLEGDGPYAQERRQQGVLKLQISLQNVLGQLSSTQRGQQICMSHRCHSKGLPLPPIDAVELYPGQY